MRWAMDAKKIDDAYDKMMKNMNKNQKSKELDKKKIDDELDKMIKHVKKNEKKLDKETKKIDDKYAKLMKDFKKDLTNEIWESERYPIRGGLGEQQRLAQGIQEPHFIFSAYKIVVY